MHVPGKVVGNDDDPLWQCLGVRKPERGGYDAFAEMTLAHAKRKGENLEPELIHQVVLKYRLEQVSATVHLKPTSGGVDTGHQINLLLK